MWRLLHFFNLTNECNVANGKNAVTFTPKDYSAQCVVILTTSSMSLEGETTHGIDGFQPLDDLISSTYIGEHPIFEIFFTPSTLICRKERLPLSWNALYSLMTHPQPVAYAENFRGGGLVQGHMVGICIWCALFVTSQFDVISMFPNQRFGEVCWHSMHIFLHPLSLYMSLHWIWTISSPS